MNSVHFSTGKDDWGTPQDLFDALNEEFNFTLDPCADNNNHKCAKYYTIEQDGLAQSWAGEYGGRSRRDYQLHNGKGSKNGNRNRKEWEKNDR